MSPRRLAPAHPAPGHPASARPASAHRHDPDIDLRRLRYFIAVCDHGGISKAASAIGIAQPALTRHIKLLEQEIGLKLIDRSGRGAEPSRQGQFLLDRSRGPFNSLNRVVREVRLLFAGSGGQVALGICPTIAPLLLDAVTRFLREHHPAIVLSVIQAYSGDLRNLMLDNRLDVALTYQQNVVAGFTSLGLFAERLVLVAGAGAAGESCDVCAAAPPSLAELGRLRLILPSRTHELRRIIDDACRARGVRLVPALELDSLDAVKATLMHTSPRYATVLPHHSVTQDVADGRLSAQPIDDPAMQRTIALVMPDVPLAGLPMQSLVGFLRRRAEELKRDLPALC